jgi:hypothetical protein
MELLTNFAKHDKHYTSSIKQSEYVQTYSTTKSISGKSYQSINQLFIDLFDPTCSILEDKGKHIYMNKLLIDIATQIDEHKEDTYDKFNYSKLMKPELIQRGLQINNSVSSLLYLSDYYKVTSSIYLTSAKVKVVTSDKDRTHLHILYNGQFSVINDDSIPEFNKGDFKEVGECFIMDVSTKDIYNKFLDPISKYKASELAVLANEVGVSLEDGGKKKVKKVLYDDINLYHLNK